MRAMYSPDNVARADASEIRDHIYRTSVCIREHELAPDLARELDLAFGLACSLASELGHVLDLARDLDFSLAPELGVASACTVAYALARDFARNLDFTRHLDSGPDHVLSRVLLESQLRGDLHKLVEMMTSARERVTDFRAVLFAESQSRAAVSAESQSRAAVSAETKDAPWSRERTHVEVARPAARVAAWSVQILPAAYHDRYKSEFGSELYDLAADGATRLDQFRHSVRLFTRAWQLRVEVKKARSRQAVS